MSILIGAANKIIAENPYKVQQARKNPHLAGWFVGQIMKATGSRYSESEVREVLSHRGIVGPHHEEKTNA